MNRVLAPAVILLLLAAAPAMAVDPVAPPAQPPTGEPPAELDASEPQTSAEEVAPSSAVAGKAFLKATCAGCHAIGAVGDSPRPEAPPFRVVVQTYAPEDLEESLAEGIVTGHPEMPQVQLEPGAIADVIAYLDALKLVTEP
jgi:cytochrome c